MNGDNKTSALDALQVINYLKQVSDTQGSGEQIAVVSVPTPSLSTGKFKAST